jgi:enoyl-[acyl-carrier-protein] reductase (NADH)
MAVHGDNSVEPTVIRHDAPALGFVSGGSQRRRIFTPSAINTIRGLAAQGKTAWQIAEVIGSTSASVRVKCCQLKIALRRRNARQASEQSLVVYLHAADYVVLRRKAADMQKSVGKLSAELLTAIIHSDIYKAVLDDDK